MDIVKVIIIASLLVIIIRRYMLVKGVNNISTAELKRRLKQKNVQLIDVRTHGEFTGSKIKEFKNIPLHELRSKATTLDKNKEVIVICRTS